VIGLGLIGQISWRCSRRRAARSLARTSIPRSSSSPAPLAQTQCDRIAQPHRRNQGIQRRSWRGRRDHHGCHGEQRAHRARGEVSRVRGRIVLVGVVGSSCPAHRSSRRSSSSRSQRRSVPGLGFGLPRNRASITRSATSAGTAQRNMAAVLDVIAAGRLLVDRLTTHRLARRSRGRGLR